jgi:hypothetical protein
MLYYFYVNSVIYFVQTFAQKLLDLSQELRTDIKDIS